MVVSFTQWVSELFFSWTFW